MQDTRIGRPSQSLPRKAAVLYPKPLSPPSLTRRREGPDLESPGETRDLIQLQILNIHN